MAARRVVSTVRVERWLARVLVLGVAVCLAAWLSDRLLVLVWGYPESRIERDFPLSAIRAPAPYVMFTGYRHQPPSGDKAPDEIRVAIVGGSAVWTGDPSLAELLEARLSDSGGPRVTVSNFGVLSQVSGQELARIVFDIADTQPDLVIMHSGGNDLIHSLTADPRPGYPFNFLVWEQHPYLQPSGARLPWWWWMAHESYLGRHWAGDYFAYRLFGLARLRRQVGYNSPEWTDQVAQAYVKHVARGQLMSQSLGAKFLASFQPLIFYKDRLAPAEEGCFGHEYMREHCLRGREAVRQQFTELAASQGLVFVDQSDVFDAVSGQVFTDSIHTTQEHFAVVADGLFQAICDHNLLPVDRPLGETSPEPAP